MDIGKEIKETALYIPASKYILSLTFVLA